MSSAAGLPAARRRGNWRAPACRSCCTRCGPCARPTRTGPRIWPSSSARIPSAPTTPQNNAVGLLHAEMRRCGSLILRAADAHRLPAGGALAVDRDGFAGVVEAALEAEPLIEIKREEVTALPPADWASVIIATGPLTAPALAEAIAATHRRSTRSPSSMRSRRSFTPTASMRARSGANRATINLAGRRWRRLHQLRARPRAIREFRRGAARRPTRSRSTTGKRTRLISTAVCRSR